MTCPQCQHKNTSSARYCATCGGSLVPGPQYNAGCFIPVILIVSVLVASILLYWAIAATSDPIVKGPELEENPRPTQSAPNPPRPTPAPTH